MNDPWDVKSVRRSGQYVSCMKLNGVPLLPPVLSKECRKEMQYYKLLAKEVEKRMAQLHPYYSDSDTEASDKTDAPELPDSEHNDEISEEEVPIELNINSNKINLNKKVDEIDLPLSTHKTHSLVPKFIENENPSVAVINSTKLVIDLSLNISESGKLIENINNITPPTEVPERDCNSPKKQKEILTDFETLKNKFDDANLSFKTNKDISDPFIDLPSHQDGPSSISSKSFTGSLIDIHTESMKESQMQPLTRQRSYTLLKPSPHLLAHLEVQSQSTGIEIGCISMSDSLSNICSPGKKRRSWDLESAKVKWSSMAMELKQKKMPNANRNTNKNQVITPVNKKQIYQPRARSVIADKSRKASLSKTLPKSEPIQRLNKTVSPVRNGNREPLGPSSPTNTTNHENKKSPNQTTLISESEDPATRVRELYEKIQKQQLLQMASLVEKQKREQMLLQQVFEEQNNLLYTQLKTICPKSPVEAKEAWVDKCQDVERGPVSLSQLINNRVDPNECDSSISTLTDTNNYIHHCDSVLKKSRDITDSLKKHATNQNRSTNVNKMESRSQSNQDGSVTRTHTPIEKNPTSRKLNYDSSTTSDQEYEPMLTDRTNDTMADVSVSFPSDQSDGNYHSVIANYSRDQTFIKSNTTPLSYRSTNSAVSNMEKPIQTSIKSKGPQVVRAQPTARECAAATKIVAYAKGYLVRRLMRTERVQSTVQTIKDALLCALELHQDREGIRGADVDLHRRLIQQITAACYSLHDTFVASSPAERCAMISTDRGRRRSLANRPPSSNKTYRQTDIMSQSYSGSLPSRNKRTTTSSIMTQSNYETFSSDKSSVSRARYLPSPRRRPWR